jgi:long-chain fatty acid transport protein
MLNEWSTREKAMGAAIVADNKDAATVAYNPAGMTELKGVQTMAGATYILPKTTGDITIDGSYAGSYDSKYRPGIVPNAYVTAQINDYIWFGLGAFSRFGLAMEFDSDWPGRFSSYYAGVNSFSINPCVAVKIFDGLSVAGGWEIMYFDFENRKVARSLTSTPPPPFPPLPLPASEDMQTTMKGDSWGYGFNLGARYEPFEWLALGFAYRSKIKQHLEGTVKYDKSTAPVANAAGCFQDADAWGNITLPDQYIGGVAVKPVKNFTVEFDLMYCGWSSYDKLEITTNKHPYNLADTYTASETKDWHDTWSYHVGIEYGITDWLDLWAGYYYDQSPKGDYYDYTETSAEHQTFSFGLGFHKGNWKVEGVYAFLISGDRNGTVMVNDAQNMVFKFVPPFYFTPPETPYYSEFHDQYAHIIGISVGYRF